MSIQGKVALVTGGSRGLGKVHGLSLARAGCNVAVAAVSNLDKAEETAKEIRAMGRKALAVKMDVANFEEVQAGVEKIKGELGPVDILVNNTGIWFRRPFLEIADSEWDNVLSVNLKGTFMCSQRAARMMMAKQTGSIINIASQAGIYYSRGQGVHYAASKAAIIQLTRVLAFELGPFGIRINAIAPGGINTGSPASTFQIDPPLSQKFVAFNPLGRRGEPQDIAQAALFLASNMAVFITGQTLVVNGGGMGYF